MSFFTSFVFITLNVFLLLICECISLKPSCCKVFIGFLSKHFPISFPSISIISLSCLVIIPNASSDHLYSYSERLILWNSYFGAPFKVMESISFLFLIRKVIFFYKENLKYHQNRYQLFFHRYYNLV